MVGKVAEGRIFLQVETRRRAAVFFRVGLVLPTSVQINYRQGCAKGAVHEVFYFYCEAESSDFLSGISLGGYLRVGADRLDILEGHGNRQDWRSDPRC